MPSWNHLERYLFKAVILLVLGVLPGQTADPGQAEYVRGVDLQQRGDLAGARDAYEAALKVAPRRVDVMSNLGLVYGQLGQYDLAVRTFQKALAVDPGQPVVRFNLALTYLQAGNFENARVELSTLLTAQPANTTARYLLGVADLKVGRLNEGISQLEKVQAAQPQNIESACTLASAYIKAKRVKEAGGLVENVLVTSDTAEAHFVSGSYYLAIGDHRKSLEQLQRAYEIKSDLPDLESALSDAYALTGNQDLAVQMFEKELRANPLDYTANAFLGWLYLEAHEIDKASTYLDRARQIKPNDPDLLFQLARLARLKERPEDAALLLEKVIAAKPNNVSAHVLLAQVYVKLKRPSDASRERSIVKQLNAEADLKQPAAGNR